MNTLAVTRSIGRMDIAERCPYCGAVARINGRACVSCLLRGGLDRSQPDESRDLDNLLAQIDVRDSDWRLGNYHILEEIGRGGMGVIYRARQRHSKRIVALKRLLSYHGDSRETLERFRREAEAAASLDHPNILPIYEVGEEEGLPYFTMKYAPGGSLQQAAPLLRADARECVRLMMKVTRAVSYAHGEGILHRDIKPGNILLDARGEPLVSDFGLAKWLDRSTDLTRTLTVFGTPGYIAPEQAHASAAQLTPAADIYSLGAVLFDLLARRPPFLGDHALSVIKQAEEKPAPKLRSLVKSANKDLETICAKCLEREPKLRYRSAADLAEDLQRWLEGRTIVARPVSVAARVWRWRQRNPVMAGLGLSALFLTAIASSAGVYMVHLSNKVTAEHASQRAAAISLFDDLDELDAASSRAEELTRAVYEAACRRRVVARLSTGNFDTPRLLWAPEQWKQLGIASNSKYVVAGSVRQSRDGLLRISYRVIEAENARLRRRDIIEVAPDQSGIASAARKVAFALHDVANSDENNPIEVDSMDGPANQTAREYFRVGKEYFSRIRTDDASIGLAYFARAIEADPQFAAAHAMYSFACIQQARQNGRSPATEWVSKAEAAAANAERLDPELALAQRAKANCAALAGRFDEAREYSLRALEADPTDQHPNAFIGYAWRMQGRPDLALRWYHRAIERGERPALNAAGLGEALFDLGQDGVAELAFKKQTEFFPDLPDGELALARLRMMQGSFAEAETLCRAVTVKYPACREALLLLGEVELCERDFGKAYTTYEKLLTEIGDRTLSVDEADGVSGAGWLRLRQGDANEGRQLIERAAHCLHEALAPAPRRRDALYSLAACHASLNDKEAVSLLRQAIEAGWLDYRFLSIDPRFDQVRSQPEFQQLTDGLRKRIAQLSTALPHLDFFAQNTGHQTH